MKVAVNIEGESTKMPYLQRKQVSVHLNQFKLNQTILKKKFKELIESDKAFKESKKYMWRYCIPSTGLFDLKVNEEYNNINLILYLRI